MAEKSVLSGRPNGEDSSFLMGPGAAMQAQIEDLIHEKDEMQRLVFEVETKLGEKEAQNSHLKKILN